MSEQMQFNVYDKEGQLIEWPKILPAGLQEFKTRGSRLYLMDLREQGRIIFQHFSQKNYNVWTTQYVIEEKTSIHLESFGDSIMVYYVVEGNMIYRNAIQYHQVGAGNVYIIPANRLDHDLLFEPGNHSVVHLFISKQQLERYQRTFPAVERLLFGIKQPLSVTAGNHDIKDQGRIGPVVSPLFETEPRQNITTAQLTAMMEEFMIASLDLYSNFLTDLSPLNSIEQAAAMAIKSYLLSLVNELRIPSLQQLSQKAAMSEKKLEDLFRQAYGVSMFDFFQTARMEAIYRMLLNPDSQLQEIADSFNYDNYSSFSAAVKKKFGLSPREIRNQIPALKGI